MNAQLRVTNFQERVIPLKARLDKLFTNCHLKFVIPHY